MSEDYSYIGVGQMYLRKRSGTTGLMPVGNVAELSFSPQEETQTLPDYTQPGGGTRNERRRITSVEVAMLMHDFSPENLSMAMFGATTNVAGGTATDESVTAKVGAIVPLANAGATSVTVTSDPAGTTYVDGTDYEVKGAGIFIPESSGISADDPLLVSYTYPEQDLVQALVNSPEEYELLFDGVNEARSGKEAVVRAWRVKFGSAESLDLIGTEYGGLQITGNALIDTSIVGTDISKYFKAAIVA